MLKKLSEKFAEFRKILKYSVLSIQIIGRNNKSIVLSSFINKFFIVIIPLIDIYIYKSIIDLIVGYLQNNTSLFPSLYYFLLFRLLTSFLLLFVYQIDNLLSKLQYKTAQLEFSNVVNEKYASLDVMHFENPELKNLFSMVQDNMYRSWDYTINIFYVFQAFLEIILSLFAMAFVAPILILFGVIVALPEFFIDTRFSKLSWGIWTENTDNKKKYYYHEWLLRDKESSKELKLFGLGKKLATESYEIYKSIVSKDLQLARKQFFVNVPSSFISSAMVILMQGYLIYRTITKEITLGAFSYVLLVYGQFNQGISGLIRTFGRLYSDSLYMEKIFEFLNVENKIIIKKDAIVLDHTIPHSIEFKDVFFRYPGAKEYIFKDFSIKINPGEKIAIVGENGAGKTTLIKLLTRFYDVEKGKVLIDGINIKDLDIESWYKCIGILFQNFIRYELTVSENIRVGKLHDTNDLTEDIIESARRSSADKFISEYDEKYEQRLGTLYDNSKDPSTGQWQKIALARGFLRDASILVLDEPTAAIDARAEYEIFKKLETLQKDKTVIIISHRFSTVRNAEMIYVIDKGRILEKGSHESLMEKNGMYADLFNLQAEGYK